MLPGCGLPTGLQAPQGGQDVGKKEELQESARRQDLHLHLLVVGGGGS